MAEMKHKQKSKVESASEAEESSEESEDEKLAAAPKNATKAAVKKVEAPKNATKAAVKKEEAPKNKTNAAVVLANQQILAEQKKKAEIQASLDQEKAAHKKDKEASEQSVK